MQEAQPRTRSIWKILLVVSVVLVVGAGAGFVYLKAAGSGESVDTADAGDTANQGEDATKSDDESGDDKKGKDGEDKKDEKDPIPVSVSELELGTLSSYVSATANLVAEDEVKVLAEAEGRVQVLKVEEGDFVAKGQLLASLVRADAEIAYQKAKVRESNAKAVFDRNSRMGTQKMISEEVLEKASTDFKLAEQELAEAKWMLDKTEIRSPFSGRVTMRNITPGKHVRLGDELFTITDFDPLIARIFLPEKDIVGLEEGREVRITLKADEKIQFAGRIRQISPVVDTATGTVKITIEAIRPPRQVRPGGFVKVAIIRETREDIVVVPREAVIRELQTAHVFVVTDEKAEKRDVTIGLEEGDLVEAISGIQPGEQVIVAGQGSLKDGEDVKVIPQATAQESSNKDNLPDQPARS
jgi:membrane fusion protein (multidrug efflux system)